MATTIEEFFGYSWDDSSAPARAARAASQCPFIDSTCTKTFHDGTPSGVCTLKPASSSPVICCPLRLYADDYQILRTIADVAFEPGLPLLRPNAALTAGQPSIAAFGHGWGGELRLPQRGGAGAYFVDWILARLDATGALTEFVAVEVQSIDTTGNYRDGVEGMRENPPRQVRNSAGFNWENVNKRILPQVIYKGHVLQREPLCRGGLFFVTPSQIYHKIMERLGGEQSLAVYPLQSSSITFMWYDLDLGDRRPGKPTPLA